MAATLTQSGTWTALSTPFTDAGRTIAGGGRNDPHLGQIARADMQTLPAEVTALVQLVADGYTLSFWPAAVLLRDWLTALITKGAPTT